MGRKEGEEGEDEPEEGGGRGGVFDSPLFRNGFPPSLLSSFSSLSSSPVFPPPSPFPSPPLSSSIAFLSEILTLTGKGGFYFFL